MSDARRRTIVPWLTAVLGGGAALYLLADSVQEFLAMWLVSVAAFTAVTLITRLADHVLR